MNIKTIEWRNNTIRIIDQTELPGALKYIVIDTLKDLYQAIRSMKIRGAPALGAAAGLGVYVGLKDSRAASFSQFKNEFQKVYRYIGSSRPTARNLFWALERMRSVLMGHGNKPVVEIKKLLLAEALTIINEEKQASRRIGFFGSKLLATGDSILTICNAGILATIDYGTALAVIYRAVEEGKRIKVYACETRPMLQGARLTCWELKRKGIEVTLLCDSMASTLMRQGLITKVITGADRIAANGDTANKIGTYALAVVCRYHKIPFYVAAPVSTFDLTIKSGADIPIEQRDRAEVTKLFFKKPIAPEGIGVYNPAFDVTAHDLISAIITDKGIIRPAFKTNIKKIIKQC